MGLLDKDSTDKGMAEGIAARQQAMKDLSGGAMRNTPAASSPTKSSKPAAVDKVNPSARYGSGKGERRIDTSEMTKTLGSASNMRPGGSDESGMSHGSNPQRAAWEDGHAVNHMYKNPVATIGTHTENHSYMHPLQNPDAAWAKPMKGKDPSVSEEKELKTKAPSGTSGKIVFSPQLGKNPA